MIAEFSNFFLTRTLPFLVPSLNKKDLFTALKNNTPISILIYYVLFSIFLLFSPLWIGLPLFFNCLSEDKKKKIITKIMNCRISIIKLGLTAFKSQGLLLSSQNVSPKRTCLPHVKKIPQVIDYLVIGSGAGGSTAAFELTKRGKEVLIIEEGPYINTNDFSPSVSDTLRTLTRDKGYQRTNSNIPVLQASCVGGTTVINGAIQHRLPLEVFEDWKQQGFIKNQFTYNYLEGASKQIEDELHIKSNLSVLLPSLPIHSVLNNLSWQHEAMIRSAPECQSSGRCLQGCPSGAKLSMEKTYIPWAVENGAILSEETKAIKINYNNKKVTEVVVQINDGNYKTIQIRKAVILAAGAIHTPLLLKKSGNQNRHIGKHLQTHLSFSAIGKLNDRKINIEGPPQGIEVTEFSNHGLKLATQLTPAELFFSKTPLFSNDLTRAEEEIGFYSSWMASIRSNSEGMVTSSFLSKPKIQFNPSQEDLMKARFALTKLSELFSALNAVSFFPSSLYHFNSHSPKEINKELKNLPLKNENFLFGIGHLFSTCRMSNKETDGVVSPDFNVFGTENLFIVDASIFPTNIGVNPQMSIMALAKVASAKIASLD